MKKEGLEAPLHDVNPEAPAPRDMVDLEVLILRYSKDRIRVFSFYFVVDT